MTDLSDLLPAGAVVLLTSLGPGGPRTRPVTIQAGQAGFVTVLTGAEAKKVAQIRAHPEVTLAGPTPGGWFAVEAVARAMEAAEPPGAVALELRLLSGRTWVVHSAAPFDNEVVELSQ